MKTILFLYDSHLERKNNSKQLKELLHYFRVKKASTTLIVEDPNTFNDHKLSWAQLRRSVKGHTIPMRNLASLLHHCGVLATSVEFRPRTSKFYSQKSTIKNRIEATSDQVKQIAQYDDGPLLNKEYEHYVERYNSVLVPNSRKLFKNIEDQGCDLNEIDYNRLEYPEEANRVIALYESLSELESYTVKQKVEKVITCYAQEAIDFKILHFLVEHAKKGAEKTVIYAGGAHIDAMKRVLKKLGYRFRSYPHINYDEQGNILPLNVAQAFQELDPSYDSNAPLPQEMIDYFFEYKEREEEDPSLKNRSIMKMFVAAADALCCYRGWKQEYPRLNTIATATLAATLVSVLCCVITSRYQS